MNSTVYSTNTKDGQIVDGEILQDECTRESSERILKQAEFSCLNVKVPKKTFWEKNKITKKKLFFLKIMTININT